jgi:hypothetical protein
MTTNVDTLAELQYPSGRDIIAAIKAAGVEFVVSVPDIVTSEGLLWPLSSDPELKLCACVRKTKAFRSVARCPTTIRVPYC